VSVTARAIKAVALDVDGVLTDDTFLWGPDGEEWKAFAFADVMGISRASRAGLVFALVSGEASPLVQRYAQKMGIEDVFAGCKDKASAVAEFAKRHGLDLAEVCFIGNDVNDVEALTACGLAAVPADAHPSARARAALVTQRPAGRGAVREVVDLLMPQATPLAPARPPEGDRSFGDSLRAELEQHQDVLHRTVAELHGMLEAVAAMLVAAFRGGNKVMFCGNGGSAADSQHLAGEFINRFRFDRAPLPAMSLTVDTSVLTCIGNDSSYDFVFSKQVEALARPGDVLVAISTSGRSRNVLQAIEAARKARALVIGFTGAGGAAHMGSLCDALVAVPSTDTARIQEAHEFSFHCIAGYVERILFPRPTGRS
jgi:D-sedoheptulose 7-phosphate isomerase